MMITKVSIFIHPDTHHSAPQRERLLFSASPTFYQHDDHDDDGDYYNHYDDDNNIAFWIVYSKIVHTKQNSDITLYRATSTQGHNS